MSSSSSAPGAPPSDGWDYLPAAGSFDEAFSPDGARRPEFTSLLQTLEGLGSEELARRWRQAQRVIRENGVTYNVYGDPRGTDRPWQLDPLPLVVGAREWAALEIGLEQRARLLDALLADLYGPARSLHQGLLPPELVLGNPAFLRPLCGVRVPGGARLHLYACDVARDAQGRFAVLGDRTQAPSGAGYALENRLVISRMLPQAFRDGRVERLAPFFQAMREGLAGLSPRPKDSPRVVLLTPGAYNETYFEHAYLARYLGYTLVEGGDLTVRDRAVHLKTLGGLERVDVIVRRLDDSYSDPLSLRPDSSLGVAGLVQAVRAGTVTVANSLGSGLLEMPALAAFLPDLCRLLLNEDLALPSVPTYFLGDEACRQQVLGRLPELVVRETRQGLGVGEPVFGGDLADSELSQLSARIQARPADFVAQERLPLSTAPAYTPDGVQPRHLTLRAFLTRRGDGYQVMPGGLTRIGSSMDSLVVSMQRGGGSKDTWVLSSGQPSQLSLLEPPGGGVAIVRSGRDLPSRAADNLFWIGRYLERAEGTTRLLRSLLARRVDDAENRAPEVAALLEALEQNLELLRGTLGRTSAGLDAELVRMLLAESPARAPAACLTAGYWAGSVVRDRISTDTWRIVSQLHAAVQQARARPEPQLSDALEIADSLLLYFSAFSGLVMDGMTHGPGWRFADLGRRIERGTFTLRLVKSTLVTTDAPAVLDAALEVADSAITYRARYLGTLALEPVLDLLLTDETNPRSVAYQLATIEEHVGALPRALEAPLLSPAHKLAVGALSSVRLADLTELARVDAQGLRRGLKALVDDLLQGLPRFAEQLTLSYLAHAQASFSLGNLSGRS